MGGDNVSYKTNNHNTTNECNKFIIMILILQQN